MRMFINLRELVLTHIVLATGAKGGSEPPVLPPLWRPWRPETSIFNNPSMLFAYCCWRRPPKIQNGVHGPVGRGRPGRALGQL